MGIAPVSTPTNICGASRLPVDATVTIKKTARMNRLAKASLLSFFFALWGAAFVVSYHSRQRLPAPAPRELFAIVNEQLSAFRSSDYPSAYRYAATGVQQKFTLPQFEKMVRQRYGEMVRARRVEFGSVKVDGATALVEVFFISDAGYVRGFVYNLISEGNGWKIDGVDELNAYRSRPALTGTHA